MHAHHSFMYTDPIFSTTWTFDFSTLCNDETDYVAIDSKTNFVRARTRARTCGRGRARADARHIHRRHYPPSLQSPRAPFSTPQSYYFKWVTRPAIAVVEVAPAGAVSACAQ